MAFERLPRSEIGNARLHADAIADHDPWAMPATIEDPATLEEIGAALKARGF